MQLPISIMQMHHAALKIVTASWQPATALGVRLENGWGFTVVKRSNCNQGLGGLIVCEMVTCICALYSMYFGEW